MPFPNFTSLELLATQFPPSSIIVGILVKDVVYEVAYDSDKDVTTLQFGNTSEGSCEWPFAGDLRERIKVGDELTFKFKIVEEYATEDYTFETLNYFLDSYDL